MSSEPSCFPWLDSCDQDGCSAAACTRTLPAKPVVLTPPWIVLKQMVPQDLMRMNEVNLDSFTENFPLSFYQQYLCEWPELCITAWGASGSIVGYIIGKVESYATAGDCEAEVNDNASATRYSGNRMSADDPLWHGHVTALSVERSHRGARIAQELMRRLELVSQSFACHFVDLFVRESNAGAVAFYKKGGYSVFQVNPEYYSSPTENAFDMRKPLLVRATPDP